MDTQLRARPRLLFDRDRVVSTYDDFLARIPSLIAHDRRRSDADRPERLCAAANLCAFHLAEVGLIAEAEELLQSQLACLRSYRHIDSARASSLALDPLLNQVRLKARNGASSQALGEIRGHLSESQRDAQTKRKPRYDTELLFDLDLERFRSALGVELLMIEWRTGVLEADPGPVALSKLAEYAKSAPSLVSELQIRLASASSDNKVELVVEKGDTLKRLLHRAVVLISCTQPPATTMLGAVLHRSICQLPNMTFQNPFTPVLWLETVRGWDQRLDGRLDVQIGEYVERQRHRARTQILRSLDRAMGPPSSAVGASHATRELVAEMLAREFHRSVQTRKVHVRS